MRQYILRRLLLLVPTLVGVSIVIFLAMRVVPGDVALLIVTGGGDSSGGFIQKDALETVRKELGLDKPLHLQYLDWMRDVLTLSGGRSLWSGKPVVEEIKRRFPVTLELAALTFLISIVIAIPSGVLSALRQDTWSDYAVRVVTIGGIAMPTFWSGTLAVLFLVQAFDWIPPLGTPGLFEDPKTLFSQIIWPALALGYYQAAVISRMTRSTMLEVLRQDYVRTAWAKGLRERMVVVRHALKNAMLPVITLSGIQIGHLLGGTVIMESIFVLPGLGSYLLQALLSRDYPVIQSLIVLLAGVFVLVNLLVDLLYGWLDPRIRYD